MELVSAPLPHTQEKPVKPALRAQLTHVALAAMAAAETAPDPSTRRLAETIAQLLDSLLTTEVQP